MLLLLVLVLLSRDDLPVEPAELLSELWILTRNHRSGT